jgi:hypothetical protein
MSKFKHETKSLGSGIEQEVSSRIPDAVCVLVVDSKGSITSFAVRGMEAHTHEEVHFPVEIKSIDSPPVTLSIMPVRENPHCIWINCGDSICCYRPPH